jgi:hypothetical protein
MELTPAAELEVRRIEALLERTSHEFQGDDLELHDFMESIALTCAELIAGAPELEDLVAQRVNTALVRFRSVLEQLA